MQNDLKKKETKNCLGDMYLQFAGVEKKMKLYIKELPILVLLLNQFTTNGNNGCEEAMSDIRIVESCPTSKEEMYKATINMKCSEFAKRNNCSNIRYHCVINEYMNETLEVCAPKRIIFGYCTEFNVAGGVIQRHAAAKCNDLFPKCDRIYTSVDAYKFPDCYTLVYKARALNKKTGHSEKDSETFEITAFSVLVLAVILCLTAVFYFALHWGKGQLHMTKKEKED